MWQNIALAVVGLVVLVLLVAIVSVPLCLSKWDVGQLLNPLRGVMGHDGPAQDPAPDVPKDADFVIQGLIHPGSKVYHHGRYGELAVNLTDAGPSGPIFLTHEGFRSWLADGRPSLDLFLDPLDPGRSTRLKPTFQKLPA
jgi:hypothetical protein